MAQYKYGVKKGIKWMVKFNYVDPATGEHKTCYKRGFDSKRDAKAYEESFREKIENYDENEEAIVEPAFEDVLDEYLASHKREDMKESTLETKIAIFEKHIFPTFRGRKIKDIAADDIAEWQQKLKAQLMPNGKHYSNAYLRTIQSQFNSVVNYAHSKGYMRLNPLSDIKNMGVKDKRVEFWSTAEYEKFAYEAMEYPEYYYAYEVLYWSGLREGEMLALTPADLDLVNGTISVTKTYQRLRGRDVISTPKTPSSVRTVSIPTFLCEELQEYMNQLYKVSPNQRIFQISKGKMADNFHRMTEKAGLKRITIHGLRHSHVSLLISRKYDIFEVSKRIGHKSVQTTQDIYGHLFDGVQRAIADDLNSMRR